MKYDFVTCGQMKILEKRADASGLSYYTMMENAGSASAEIIRNTIPSPISNAFAMIFCGKGNNGGDGFVVARKLLEWGARVMIVLIDGIPVTADAKKNYDRLLGSKVLLADLNDAPGILLNSNPSPSLIVDAMYGTGFHGKLETNSLKAAAYINQLPKEIPVFALDIPSGLGGDSLSEKKIDTRAVRADYTLAFHNKKPVHLKKFSRKYCGEVIIVDIGIDEEALW